jgi:RNA polymerase subunit RPABC4/transcription elongation factor Spt4/uncharacterized tellurite resistance protein B-like protein
MELSENEKIGYLANLYAVARADGSISPNELQVIEAAQKRLKARKTSLKKANMAAQAPDFAVTAVGVFSTTVANLEDMVYVSLSDGTFDQDEKPLIIDFARKIGVTNDQLKVIVAQIKRSLVSSDATRACPSCSAAVPREAKFCPECGGSLQKSDKEAAVAVDYRIPTSGIAIEFAESTAVNFPNALTAAKRAPTYEEAIKGKKTWYMAAWPKDAVASAAVLAENLKGMRNRKVWVDSEEVRWDEVFSFTWCSAQRSSAYRPLEYCYGVDEKRLNIWGCKNTRMDWTKWADWFSYGSFQKAGMLRSGYFFVFDKKRIRHELESSLFKYRYCPHLNFQLIEAIDDILPDQVEVKPNGDWGYRREYEKSPGAIKVKERTVEDGYTFESDFWSSGVEPRSPELGLNLIEKAMKVAGCKPEGIKELLRYSGD